MRLIPRIGAHHASPDSPVGAPRTERLAWRLLIALFVIVPAAFGLIFYLWHRQTNTDQQLADARHGERLLYSQAVQHGASPSITPPGAPAASKVSGAPGPRGASGPGPSDVQIADAVAVYCSEHGDCVGTPSFGQVHAAVSAFCATGLCRGPAGPSGGPGAAGASGAVGAAGASGAPGSGPTDEQVTTAVAAYCAAHNDCTGPAGPKGDTGASGSPGRGITSIDCTGIPAETLTIHYDDGTEQTVTCNKLAPAPSPS